MTRLLEAIPATFWGVLAGSFFTLLGVWLTNRAQAQRLERQLNHESTLRSEERALTIKRDVYLPAAEAISAGVAVVGRLPDLSIPQERLLDDWTSRSPAIARVNLVAGDQTLNALTQFSARLGTTLLGLFGVRLRLVLRVAERQGMLDEVTRLSSENGNRVALIQQMHADGSNDAVRRATLAQECEIAQERIAELLGRHKTLNLEVA